MDPRLKNLLIMAGAIALAPAFGWQIATGEYFWPLLALLLGGIAITNRLTGTSADVVFLGLVVVGYLVGNRGFAQLRVLGNFPLFPAEVALAVAGAWRVAVCALERRLPVHRDWLNVAIGAWLVLGTARVAFDLPVHGFLALRDYAMVYYAAFFFLAQHMAREPRARTFLFRSLIVGLAVLTVVGPLYEAFPQFFWTQLTVGGSPVIFFKGDLLNTFLGCAAVLIFAATPERAKKYVLPLTVAVFVYVLFGNNRASSLALLVAASLYAVAGRGRFPKWHFGAATCVAVIAVGTALFTDNDWAQRKITGVVDRVASVVDPTGVRSYRSEESGNKGDNNRFRWTWWKTVVRQTVSGNPVFGIGFGEDLASAFVREYSPELADEFTTRSPHNMFVTTFGRMGAVGVLVWTAVFGLTLVRAWQALRRDDERSSALWLCATMMLVSAIFGVVLEGPMGALPFWTLLGLANAREEILRATADVKNG